MSYSLETKSRPRPGRGLLWLGLAIVLASVAVYAAQVMAHRLKSPWYLPYATTLGVALVAVSLWQARTVWRVLALLLVAVIAGGTWMLILGTRLPPYTGPVAVGRPFPAFQTARADGTPFTDRDLQGDKDSVMVFFRGRW
jgi:hypothetical protein